MENWLDEALINTPFGGVFLQVGQSALDTPCLKIELLPSQVGAKTPHHPWLKPVYEHINRYLHQAQHIIPLVAAPNGSVLQQRVWQVITTIPSGHTRTYSDLALQLGTHPRVVANACGANPLPLMIPCHRVLAKHGLGGFMRGASGGLHIKRWLLQHERSAN